MKPERTADDKVLALLARLGRALEYMEVAKELNWSRRRASQVLLRLALDHKLVVIPGQARDQGEAGRPPALYALPQHAPTTQPNVAHAVLIFPPDTIVVTPLDREARVIRQDGELVTIEYRHVRLGEEPTATVRAKLLRAYQAGRERPEPMRILPDPLAA
jgi:predicted ArsR family transcriptional regulator